MIDHDRLFKELLTTFFVEFLDLFFPEVLRYLDTSKLEFLDKELFTDVTSGDTYEADIVVKAAFRERPAFFIIHVEHQAQAEEAFDLRMFRYFALEHFKHGVPIYPIALCSDRPYRRAWTAQRVRAYIRAQAGTHFDPHIVDVFLGMLDNDQ